MATPLSYFIFNTKLGWMGVSGSGAGLKRIVLPRASPEMVVSILANRLAEATPNPSFFRDIPYRLKRYLDGDLVYFPDQLDLTEATPFQRAVWEVVRSIPHGETRSYAWLAQQIGMPQAAWAVGQALARNPLPIVIPCHQVVGSKGGLYGFSAGLEMKQYLLGIEARTRLYILHP